MAGWAVAAMLLIERGLSWWQAFGLVAVGVVAEFFGNAAYDGIKQVRQERQKASDQFTDTLRAKVQSRMP